jgi:prepilin-type N-terminal cleavage/methylation domain-containing protein
MTCSAPLKAPIRANRGFTLLEVLVSLTIMSLIVTVAFAGFSVAIDSWERGSRKIEELDRRFAVERLLQRQIEMADPATLSGDDRRLEFVSSYSLANGPGDPVRLKYELSGNDLVYSETSIGEYAAGHGAGGLNQTFPGLAPKTLGYLVAGPNGVRDWVNSGTNGVPLAVKVDIAGDVLVMPLVHSQ